MREDQASTTALLVQQGLLFTASRPSTRGLVSEAAQQASRRLLLKSGAGRRLLGQLDGVWRLQVALKERLLVPGICAHYAVRKRWIEEQVRAAIDDGARQVLNLGAGFDTLALRLAQERDDLVLIEVDHPATLRAKRQALVGEGGADRLTLLPVDFTRETLAERLPHAEGFDRSLRTVVVCEGVLPYLDADEARVLFRSLREELGPGTRVAFTFIGRESPTGRQPFGPLLRVFLTLSGESMRLRCDPDELRELLAGEGLTLDEVAIGPDLLRQYGASDYRGAVHDLEMLASASVDP